jgi:hypothetical protein
MKTPAIILASLLLLGGGVSAQETYYKEPTLFSTAPSPTKSINTVGRFGPVGMAIDLVQPAFTMKIKSIEEGSPAAATGKLKPGQFIETINGEKLADIDPRIQLANILGTAEASDGVLKFAIKGEADPVVVKVPVLGAYSKTWPLDCPKSDRIVHDFADYLSKPESDRGRFGIGMLFLLSTGEDKYLPTVRDWARGLGSATYAWELGYGGIPLCEYYLRTGDAEVFPIIQQWADNAVKAQFLDGWAGRGGVPAVTYGGGGGHLNAGGTAVVTFMLLAKECGAEIPDHALLGALTHFFRYAARGGNPYGDNKPEVGFVDNGKNGNLAIAMAAAASLTPDGESSIYAAARDAAAMTSFYTTSFMLHGHTGGGIGEIWRSAAMGVMSEKTPNEYREFMDQRKWHYELSRRWDGSFAILGGAGYDDVNWGAGYGLAYTMPRKTLQISGAPPTKFSKPYQLPKQPWGTEADNEFLSLEAVPDASGNQQDLSKETIAKDSSMQFIRRFHGTAEVSDDDIRQAIHHRDHAIRFIAANKALGINSGYIGWRAPGGEVRTELVMEFLRSKSPRVRRAMFSAITEILAREKRTEALTRGVFDLAVKAVEDPAESWWVKDAAMELIGNAPADWVAPHTDLLLTFLKHDEWWLRNAALIALTPVVADERCYQRVLPAVGELVQTNQRWNLTAGPMYGIREKLKDADEAVGKLAAATLRETFTEYEGVKTAETGQDITSTYNSHMDFIAASLAAVPGGLEMLYEVAADMHPEEILPYKELYLSADPKRFGPKLKKAIPPIILGELVPEFVGRNRVKLRQLEAGEAQNGRPGGAGDLVDQLGGLYARAGQDEYGWHMFADIRNGEWSYHSFDPIPAEQVPWDQVISRYREVTLPGGMENWFAPDFDPIKAGWKTGKTPIGQYGGKIPEGPIMKCTEDCVGPVCYGATPVNTLWEKEVLLMRGTFAIPPLKDGYRYRISVNDGNHPGAGGGHIIYINGKPLIETKGCNGRGSSDQPKGAFITKEFLDDFRSGKVDIAVKTFIRYNDKFLAGPTENISRGHISFHFDEMKLPPMGDDLVLKSASLVPMMSSEWQAKVEPENAEQGPDDNKFRWDGKFTANPNILGAWKVIGEEQDIAAFDPTKKKGFRKPIFETMNFADGGKTGDPTWIWSGDKLMDLTRYQALGMQVKEIAGTDYLFIESGGFSTRQKPGWKPTWLVLARE